MRKDGINKDSIFNLFDSDNLQEDKVKVRKSLDDFIKSPYSKIGMFTKLILNHEIFHQKLQKFLEKEEPNYNISSTKEAGDYAVFNRSWHYIKEIDVSNADHVKSILEFNYKMFFKALQDAILYFEQCEQYEKCAHLLKIQQLAKNLKNN